MKKNKTKPLLLALYGMDERTHKTMAMYLKGPYKGKAIIVDEFEAEVDLIDADYIKAKDILEQRKQKTPERPIILLSLEKLSIEGTLYVKKPIQTEDLAKALKLANNQLNLKSAKPLKAFSEQSAAVISEQEKVLDPIATEKQQPATKNIDKDEIKKTSKHRTAKDLTEGHFSSYIGHVEGVDFSDPEQVINASFNPKEFFLGFVQSALRVSKEKGRILQLNSGWKPLVFFPLTQEIWLDANEKQLRAFAGLQIKNNSSSGMNLVAADTVSSNCNRKMEGFYEADHFLWMLAVWTSKGRYPNTININEPVFLKQWPNFTRLLVTPHAMRIAALLVMQPRTAMSVANALKIKPQYVFVFISAANAVGLLSQVKRQADELISPADEVKPSKTKGLLGRILGRLRG